MEERLEGPEMDEETIDRRSSPAEFRADDLEEAIHRALALLHKLNESGQSLKLRRAIELLEDVV